MVESFGHSAELAARGRVLAALVIAALAPGLVPMFAGCSVGEGTGEIGGPVMATDCNVDVPDYQLSPSFFAAQVTGDQLSLRVQRGSDFESYADGLMIAVRDVNEVKQSRIGLPIRIVDDYRALVQVIFYLNESCDSGFPSEYRRQPVILAAQSGTITFRSIYAPGVDTAGTAIEADLADVVFVDPDHPAERNATLNGSFSFFYQRGSPAQRFP